MTASDEYLMLILMADGDTDYLFMEKALIEDPDISVLPIKLVRPEDVGLKRRSGGGHRTLLKESGLAAIRAVQGYAHGVLILVDNDGDPRFTFPHDKRCNDCRECDAWEVLEKINWGQPIKKGAAILYQAIETLLLSARTTFTPQLEERLFSQELKQAVYGRPIGNITERYQTFKTELNKIQISKIKAKSYPRLKQILRDQM